VSVARFIADQRTFHRVPPTLCCALLGVSISWLYKWLGRAVCCSAGERRVRRDRPPPVVAVDISPPC
jgi:putative transposase